MLKILTTPAALVTALLVAALVFAACRNNSWGFGGKDVRVPLEWVEGGTREGGKFTLGPGDYGRRLESGGIDRFYEIHAPKGYDGSRPTPLVLMFHGGGGYPGAIRYESGMDRTADKNGFLVAYPAGTNKRWVKDRLLLWNDGREYQDGSKMEVDDVRFVRDLLDDMAQHFNVDPKRVYSAGFSNGAQFTFRLAKQCSDRIAAIATVAGQRPVDGIFPAPPRAVPLMQFSGKQDKVGPYDGGEPNFEAAFKTELLPVEKTVRTWAAFNGCSDEPAATRRVGKAVETRFGPGKDGAEVVLWTLEDGGHTWPGGNCLPAMDLGPINQDIQASDLIWEFFRKHPMK